MWKRLKDYIAEIDGIDFGSIDEKTKEDVKQRLLQQIAFFQHERLVHLIVTVVFALLAFIDLIAICLVEELLLAVLEILFSALLIPYVIHYYRLENGVQDLYEYYDELTKNDTK